MTTPLHHKTTFFNRPIQKLVRHLQHGVLYALIPTGTANKLLLKKKVNFKKVHSMLISSLSMCTLVFMDSTEHNNCNIDLNHTLSGLKSVDMHS